MRLYWYSKSCYFVEHNNKLSLFETEMPDEAQKVLAKFAKYELGYTRLENLFISHFHHNGHSGGAAALIDAFQGRINRIVSSGIYSDGDSDNENYSSDLKAQNRLKEQIKLYNIEHHKAEKGDIFEYGGLEFRVISPLGDYASNQGKIVEEYQHNGYILMISVEYGDFKFIHSGDMKPTYQIEALEEMENAECTFFHVAHHGDGDYINNEIIDLVDPEIFLCEFDRHGIIDFLEDEGYTDDDYIIMRPDGTDSRGEPFVVETDFNGDYEIKYDVKLEDEIDIKRVNYFIYDFEN